MVPGVPLGTCPTGRTTYTRSPRLNCGRCSTASDPSCAPNASARPTVEASHSIRPSVAGVLSEDIDGRVRNALTRIWLDLQAAVGLRLLRHSCFFIDRLSGRLLCEVQQHAPHPYEAAVRLKI